MRIIHVTWLIVALGSAYPQVAAAQDRASGQSLPLAPVSLATIGEVRGQIGASINNAGLQLSFDLSKRRPLFASRHPLLSEAHVAVGGSTALTPAHARGGVWVEAAPLSVFVLRAGAEPAYYFGTFDSLTSFAIRHDAFDTDSRRIRGGAESGTATRFYVTPTLRARAGRVLAQVSADLEWWSSNAAGPFFYEPTRDTLLETSGDRLTTLTGAVLYEPLPRLTAGVTYARMQTRAGSVNQVQRVGVVAIKRSEGRFLTLDRPSLTISAARYLEDPYKQGEWTVAVAIGFSLHR